MDGWQLSWNYVFQSGGPLTLPLMQATGVDPWLDPGERTRQRWFKTEAFRVQPAFTTRTLSPRSSHMLGQPINNMDMSLSKVTPVTERFRIETRADVFEVTNRVQLQDPVVNPSNASYGRIPGVYGNRKMQLSLRMIF